MVSKLHQLQHSSCKLCHTPCSDMIMNLCRGAGCHQSNLAAELSNLELKQITLDYSVLMLSDFLAA